MVDIWYYSDPHYWHKNIIRLCNRPFDSVEDMNWSFIEWYNTLVKPNDVVYCLGDFAFKKGDEIVKHLHGKKILLKGNHDSHKQLNRIEPYFDKILDSLDIVIDNQRIMMNHYPYRTWRGNNRGSWNIHGHCHANLPPMGKQLDVGYDNFNYEVGWKKYHPIHHDQLKKIMDSKDVYCPDHHVEEEKK